MINKKKYIREKNTKKAYSFKRRQEKCEPQE